MQLILHQEEGSLLIITKNTTYKYSLLSSNKDTLTPESFGRHHTSAPDLKGVLSSSVFCREIGSIQSSVEKNPHHKYIIYKYFHPTILVVTSIPNFIASLSISLNFTYPLSFLQTNYINPSSSHHI